MCGKLIVNGYELDGEQNKVVYSDEINSLVIAGAGSGKSLTIVGKIKYLIEEKNIYSNEILCVSFTNDSCLSLKNSLSKNNFDVDVLTFHKLSLKILKQNKINISISNPDLLEYVIDEYFSSIIYSEDVYIKFVLKYYKVKYSNKDYIYKYKKLFNDNKINIIKKIIKTFICLFKSNGKSFSYLNEIFFREISSFNIFINKNVYLIAIITRIFYEYETEMKSTGSVDFDDMIRLATKEICKSDNSFNYKYIIIDEFQDTSMLRYNLIINLIKKCGAHFLAVGDDYQSIYRFTGCDLYLFLNFKDYFESATIYKIQNTYRNSIELVSCAARFIQKNSKQIVKKLNSNKELTKPIKIIYYNNEKNIFIKLLDYLYNQNKRNILVLGRNNNTINDVIDSRFYMDEFGNIKYSKYNEMNIRYLTVHKSKGLECDYVIVLSLVDDVWGFPNKKIDEKIFNYVLPIKEKYLFSEERRLFYVAITRTKNEVYLLTDRNRPSIFVCEILKDSKKYIDVINF